MTDNPKPAKQSLRERLLEALGDVTFDDLPDDALVVVFLEQTKRLKRDLFEAQSAILKEGMRSEDIQRQAHEEIRQLRTNPLASCPGDFFFVDPAHNVTYIVSIDRRDIRLCKRISSIDYPMQRISVEEYMRRVEGK